MPVRIDTTPAPLRGLPRGTYFLEVKDAEEKESQSKSESMLKVTFRVRGGPFGGEEVIDHFMLEGKGRGIGHEKLGALGIDIEEPFEASDLIGKRAYAAIVPESRQYNGKTYTNARIDVGAEGSRCGLWSEDMPPAGVDTSVPPDDEGPF